MKLTTILSSHILAVLFTLSMVNAAEWSYEAQKHWSSIQDHNQHEIPHIYPYAVCGIGQHQSPVDLATSYASKRLNNLKFRYYADAPNFFNTGHAVQVNLSNDYQGELLIGKEAYPLIQMHFHEPSEHVIGARTFPAELHFVHVREDGYVLTDTTKISEAQLGQLKSFFSGNARLPQELNNRTVAKKK